MAAGVTGKHIFPAKLYLGFGLAYKVIANPYPEYGLAVIFVCQTVPWVASILVMV